MAIASSPGCARGTCAATPSCRARSCVPPASSTAWVNAPSPRWSSNRSFTARSVDRLIKVALTIADLMAQDDIDAGCLLEAASFRDVDPTADISHVA
jgi:predicted ATPase with chaperone activity